MALPKILEKLFCKSMKSLKFWEKAVMAVYQKEGANRLEDLLLSKLWKVNQTLNMKTSKL